MDTNKKPRNEEQIKKDESDKAPPAADDTNRKSDEIREENQSNN